MSYEELKIGKLVQTVLKPLIIKKASLAEVQQMQELEYSKSTFGLQYPLLLKTSSSIKENRYYSELFTLYGDTYRLCSEWFETPTNNDRPYVEKWIREHEENASECYQFDAVGTSSAPSNDTLDDFHFDFQETPKKQVTIQPQNGIAIGEGQYKERNDLTVVEIPEGVTYIGRDAFMYCANLEEIILPDSVVAIDECAFYCCRNLKKIKLPRCLRWLGNAAFYCCESLESINIPEELKVIPAGCFSDCKKLKKVVGSSIEIIDRIAFKGCTSLPFISLYEYSRLRYIGDRAFADCGNLLIDALNRMIIPGDYDVEEGKFQRCIGFSPEAVMVADDAFDWDNLTIRTYRDAFGAKLAKDLWLKAEYVNEDYSPESLIASWYDE